MPRQVITGDLTTSVGVREDWGDHFYLAEGASINTLHNGYAAAFSYNCIFDPEHIRVTIAGEVTTAFAEVAKVWCDTESMRFRVTETGVVNAIVSHENVAISRIVNEGTIQYTFDTDQGLWVVSIRADLTFIDNSGTINVAGRGARYAIYITDPFRDYETQPDPELPHRIVNTGTISLEFHEDLHPEASTIRYQDDGRSLEIVNRGEILAPEGHYAINVDSDLQLVNTGLIDGGISLFGYVPSRIVNHGMIDGNINFGGYDDVYRVAGTGQTTGTVYGEDGDDLIVGGGFDDRIVGTSERGLTYQYDAPPPDVERSRAIDRDRLFGNGGDDWLHGGADHDFIDGGTGDDEIIGGYGADRMRGGEGSDVFIYEAPDDTRLGLGRDRILDFEAGQDRLDLSALELAFGEGRALGGGQASVWLAETANGATLVRIDDDGDGVTDAEIVLVQASGVTEDDLLL